jgi:hypothetical protein
VTLDPGLDLGHAPKELIDQAYKKRLTPEQYAAVEKVMGIKGDAAKAALKADPVLETIRVRKSTATEIFPHVAGPYWRTTVDRFRKLKGVRTPSQVHTAMLSIAYNRGASNRHLEVLKEPIAQADWARVADLIGSMQQKHKLVGIRKRRRAEAELIRSALA